MVAKDKEQIFDTYKERLAFLQKLFLIFTGILLFFFFIAIIPYFSLKSDLHDVYQVDNYINTTLIKSFSNITKDDDKLTQLLASKIPSAINTSVIGNKTNLSPYNDLHLSSDYLKSLTKTINNITKDITYAVSSINKVGDMTATSDILNVNTITDIKNQLSQFQKILANYRDELTLNESSHDAQATQQSLSRSIVTLNTVVRTLQDNIKNQRSIVHEHINSLIKDFVANFKNFQAPMIGTIPIDFNALIAIFPIGLAISFAYLGMILCQTLSLRRLLLASKDPRIISDDEMLSAISPPLINPLEPKSSQFTAWIILLTPCVFYVLSVTLIIYVWEVYAVPGTYGTQSFVGAHKLNEELYLGLYAACSLFFLYVYIRIYKEYKEFGLFRLHKDRLIALIRIEKEVKEFILKKPEQADLLLQKIKEFKSSFYQ